MQCKHTNRTLSTGQGHTGVTLTSAAQARMDGIDLMRVTSFTFV